MAIKQFISLEGAEEVVANLKKVQVAGEQAIASFKASGQQFIPSAQFAGLVNSANQATGATGEMTRSTNLLAEAFHLLHPILAEAGVSMGEFRAFSVLARGGVELLALGIGGALVVAAAKAADEFKSLQANMAFLFGTELGSKISANVKQLATDLGTSAANIAPAMQSIELALSHLSTFKSVGSQPGEFFRGLPQDADKAKAAVDALLRQLELLGQTGAQAGPEVAKFFEAIGKIDPNTLKPIGLTLQGFLALSPQIQQALDNAFGGNLLQKLQAAKNQTIDFQKVLDNLARADVSISIKPIDKNVAQSFDELKSSAQEFLAALGEAGATTAFQELSKGIRGAVADLNTANFQPLKSEISATESELNDLNTAFQNAGKAVHDFLGINIQAPKIAPSQFGLDVFEQPTVFEALKTNFNQTLDELKSSSISAWSVIKQIFSDGTLELQSDINNAPWTWTALVSSAQAAFDSIKSAWQQLVAFINQDQPKFQSPAGPTSFSEFAPGGAAGGGHIRGPGSWTSDSILARLSNNEFVMRAASVQHYGVDLMHAINSMRLPKDFFRGFNMGGLVMPSFPPQARFAQGGLASAGSRSLTLVLGGQSFALSGQKSAVDQLERAADLHNLSRLGRAPGWVK